jgi:diguanylate cyclase (GGDEF)-like protein
MPQQTPSAPSKMQKLRESFLAQLPVQLGSIRRMFEALPELPAKEALEEFHRAIHSLKGASAAFGLKELSAAAGEGERLALAAMRGASDPAAPWREEMAQHFARMERALAADRPGSQADSGQIDIAVAEAIHSGSERKLVYLCEDDPFQLTSLTTQISCFGFEVAAFQDLDAFHDAVRKSTPDVIVMDMVHPGNRTGGAQMIEKIRAGGASQIPVVYITTEGDIGARLAAVRAGCDAYFVKPINPTDLCQALQALTSAEKPDPYRIMVVDDDPNLSGLYSTILQQAGMETLAVNDPLHTLPHLTEFKPDLILMDMHMPGCSGLELAGVIRQMGAYVSIPIIFLSSETDEDLQCDAKRIGGDEFLHKTIKPEHLVSTVAVRAQRMKHLRSLMIRDSMTGLFNHSTTKEYLELNVTRAQRLGENVCFVMIDLDHFKGINDRHGHPTGDRVLVATANLLRQRLRKSDAIGRYGGEEFAVILPGISMTEAVALMDNLRQCFETIRFPVDDAFFTATFSCGVASLSSHDSAEKLCLAADQALYTAKKEGRNRVVAAGRFVSAAQLREMRVLVVEDSPPIRDVLIDMLGGVGFAKIISAGNGRQAWDILQAGAVDLIVADWRLPVMDGLTLLKLVRADAALAEIPFVMITGEGDKSSVREAVRAGVTEYILKPVYAEELSKKIIRALCQDRRTAS